MMYRKFFVMMLISFCIMYVVMFLNIDKFEHYHTSITRIYMAILMVAPMAVIMLLMMPKMYPQKRLNTFILLGAITVFVATFVALRSQTPVKDIQYMKAMIPHHSSAILTSKHAHLQDPGVIRLSRQIIESQEREIAEMEEMIKRLEQ